jgi:hypothetical protein
MRPPLSTVGIFDCRVIKEDEPFTRGRLFPIANVTPEDRPSAWHPRIFKLSANPYFDRQIYHTYEVEG